MSHFMTNCEVTIDVVNHKTYNDDGDEEDEDFDLGLAKSIRSLDARIQIRSRSEQFAVAAQTKWNSNQLMMMMVTTITMMMMAMNMVMMVINDDDYNDDLIKSLLYYYNVFFIKFTNSIDKLECRSRLCCLRPFLVLKESYF